MIDRVAQPSGWWGPVAAVLPWRSDYDAITHARLHAAEAPHNPDGFQSQAA